MSHEIMPYVLLNFFFFFSENQDLVVEVKVFGFSRFWSMKATNIFYTHYAPRNPVL